MLVGPGTLLIVGLIGGAGAAATYTGFAYARQKGPELTKSLKSNLGRGQTVNELLPMPPDQGPPLPRGLGLKWPGKK